MRRQVLAMALLAVAAGTAHADTTVVVGAPGTTEERVAKAERAFADHGSAVVTWKPDASEMATQRARAGQQVAAAIEAAGEAYLNERYDDAIRELEAIEDRVLVLLLPTPGGRALLVQMNLWLGALHGAAGETDLAGRRFGLALSMQPAVVLDPAVWPPDIIQVFAKARDATAANATAIINVEPEARVEIDGHAVEDPTTLELSVGWHYVYAYRVGHGRWAQRLTVDLAKVTAISKLVGNAKPEELAEDAANAMERHYADQPKRAVQMIASASGAQHVAVVAAAEVFLYDSSGALLSSAAGADVAAAVRALGTGKTPSKGTENGKKTRPIYKKWWFWAAAGAVAVAGGVGIYSLTRDDDGELRGRFIRPQALSIPLP